MFIPFPKLLWARIRKIFFGLLWFSSLISFPCHASDLNVLLVLSDRATPYQAFATTFKQKLPANVRVNIQEHFKSFPDNGHQADLIVAVGVNAGNWVVAHTTGPVLVTMLPSSNYPDLLAKRSPARKLSAIFIDQPLERQVSLVRAALPEHTRIGVLHSAKANIDTEKLRRLLQERGATLVTQLTGSSGTLFGDLESILSRSDVLFAVPDKAIYNADTFRNIMQSSYLKKTPLIGYSQSYVNAGAACAVFSTVEQMAAQTASTVISFAQTGKLPEPQYPTDFAVAVNQPMAKTLGITLSPPEIIRAQMGKEKDNKP